MHEIGGRVCLQRNGHSGIRQPEPYEQLTGVLNIARLRLAKLVCKAMHANPDAFYLLMIPSLRRMKLNSLDTSDWPHNHFWPSNCHNVCSARKIVVNFHANLPKPLVVADLLRRCSSLQVFELRGPHSGHNYKSAEAYIENVDCMANIALRDSLRPDVKGLPGYADLIRCSLGDFFAEMQWGLSCFRPCDRLKHQRQPLRCICTAVCIGKAP